MSQPLVSVFLPTKERPHLLSRALDSVLRQSYEPIEVIVVIDGADKESVAVLDVAAKTRQGGKQLRIIPIYPARGACAARNTAIWASQGAYVTGLDDDDYFLPTRIDLLVRNFDPKIHSFVFTGHRVALLNSSDDAEVCNAMPRFDRLSLKQLLRFNEVGNQVLTTRERILAVQGFDEGLPAWQDYDLWIRLVKKFGPAGGIKDDSYVIDRHSADIRISRNLTAIEVAANRFIEKHVEYLNQPLRAFLRLSEATYGGDILSLRDIMEIGMRDATLGRLALWHFLLAKSIIKRI